MKDEIEILEHRLHYIIDNVTRHWQYLGALNWHTAVAAAAAVARHYTIDQYIYGVFDCFDPVSPSR